MSYFYDLPDQPMIYSLLITQRMTRFHRIYSWARVVEWKRANALANSVRAGRSPSQQCGREMILGWIAKRLANAKRPARARTYGRGIPGEIGVFCCSGGAQCCNYAE